MTADAKVGLLLGLFFIVIIAFLVNGLPNFIQEENTSPASVTITPQAERNMVLDNSGVSEAVHRLYRPRSNGQRTMPPQETPVPDSPSRQTPQIEIPDDIVPQRQAPAIVQSDPPTVIQEVAEPVKAQTHVVKSGEILPIIAKLYYGQEQGNRRIVIQKLYEANTGVLKSPDRVCVGQKLTIPSLDELLNTSGGVVKAPNPSKGLLSKFPAIFKRVEKKDTALVSEYTVQEGDSLWSIAQQKLGNGSRHVEISRMNKIKNGNDIVIGTRLKIPIQ